MFVKTRQAVDYGDLCAAIDHFYEGYHLLLQMPPYVQYTPAAPMFNHYIQRANELNFKITSGYVTLNDFRTFLSPLTNVVSSFCGPKFPFRNCFDNVFDGNAFGRLYNGFLGFFGWNWDWCESLHKIIIYQWILYEINQINWQISLNLNQLKRAMSKAEVKLKVPFWIKCSYRSNFTAINSKPCGYDT